MHSRIASLAVSIGKPLIEPLLSITKTSSLGTISCLPDPLGRLQHEREELAALVGVGQHRVFDLVAGRLVDQHEVLVGDRLLLVLSLIDGPASCRRRDTRPSTACCFESIRRIGRPALRFTVTEMSCPARVPSGVTGGVMRSASGTWSVGGAQPVVGAGALPPPGM